ncbi:hypothetical protein NW755_012912 [Fusarium falciforme]|uniref:Xylanolytic transcriptional activator regulatory domain-containing protein n=1 Tax=Fusarium falciforme TaxID=195108 RepID=A0A9W8QWU8_9HYPO|nr:hypothetical protein NW755_012912 [Fusarium falciforme]KAJ4238326.1 hypothetical protein NW757_013142 [Fusarium falciforme]
MMDRFIRQYFLYVHPILPLVKEQRFWDMYQRQNWHSRTQDTISLFVLQAMLFMSCPFIPLSALGELGFSSVREARAKFYSKAKTLFDVIVHRDDISNAQGALMLTYHASGLHDKTNTYWLGIAIHFARSAGAHQYNSIGASDQGDAGLLKRLWWCCILRDRIMSLGLQRPLLIRPADFDFHLPGLQETDLNDEIRGSEVYSPTTKKVMAQLAASLCGLGVALNDILAIIHPIKEVPRSEDPLNSIETFESHITKLEAWHDTAVAIFTIPAEAEIHDSLTLFTSAMYIYYDAAKALVYNYVTLLPIPGSGEEATQGFQRFASQEVERSIDNMTQNLTRLEEQGLTKYLPNTFVAFSALPFMWRRSSDGPETKQGQQHSKAKRLQIYVDIFRGFGKLYDITDSLLECIDDLAE